MIAPAHPRSRGENRKGHVFANVENGSSPLTRGKQYASVEPHPGGRLIPAHAGKTASFPRLELNQPAHPRSRGENHCDKRITTLIHGSSPLTRGKLFKGSRSVFEGRLIPAHAGKTYFAFRVSRCFPAHPRSRGENCLRGLEACLRDGSSPLTRGKLMDVMPEIKP